MNFDHLACISIVVIYFLASHRGRYLGTVTAQTLYKSPTVTLTVEDEGNPFAFESKGPSLVATLTMSKAPVNSLDLSYLRELVHAVRVAEVCPRSWMDTSTPTATFCRPTKDGPPTIADPRHLTR